MQISRVRLLFPSLLLLVLCSFAPALHAQIGIPDLGNSWCQVDPGQFVLVPGGNGPTLADQGVVIHLWLRDNSDLPIWSYPREDIWMWNAEGDISLCPNGLIADANTDAEGHTTLSGAGAGGGWTQSGMTLYVSGIPVAQTPRESDFVLDLQVNSPDINGDLVVNLQDISLFTDDLPGYAFRSDFNFDGETDLSDISLFAAWLASSGHCP